MPSHCRGQIVELDFLQRDLATEVQWYKQQIQYAGRICEICTNLHNHPVIGVLYVSIKNKRQN